MIVAIDFETTGLKATLYCYKKMTEGREKQC